MTEILEQAVASVAPTLDFTPAPGFDIIIIAGQSNTAWGWGTAPNTPGFDPALDGPHERIWQFGRARAGANNIIPAVEPLEIPADKAPNISSATSPNDSAYSLKLIGFGLAYAKQILANGHPVSRNLLLVPAGVGSTGFSNNRWTPEGDLYLAMRDQARAAASAAGANVRFHSMLWCQGESDITVGAADYKTTKGYMSLFDKLVGDTRAALADYPGGADIPVLVLSTNPDYAQYATSVAKKNTAYALKDTPRRLVRTSFTLGASGNKDIHYSAAAQRLNGKALANSGLRKALQNVDGRVPTKPWDLAARPDVSKITLTWSPVPGRTTKHLIQCKAARDADFRTIADADYADGELNIYEVSSLTTGIYSLRVFSKNNDGMSDAANVMSFTQTATNIPATLISTEGMITTDDKNVIGANDLVSGKPVYSTATLPGFPGGVQMVAGCKMVAFGQPGENKGLSGPVMPNGSWSVTMLVRFDQLKDYQHLFSSSVNTNPWYFWRTSASGKNNCIAFGSTVKGRVTDVVISSTAMEIDRLYAITAVVERKADNSGTKITLYQNGAAVGTGETSEVFAGPANLGNFAGTSVNKNQFGYWAAVRTDHIVLTADEIAKVHSDLAIYHGLELKDGRIQAKV